jgi:hypothetical protein
VRGPTTTAGRPVLIGDLLAMVAELHTGAHQPQWRPPSPAPPPPPPSPDRARARARDEDDDHGAPTPGCHSEPTAGASAGLCGQAVRRASTRYALERWIS